MRKVLSSDSRTDFEHTFGFLSFKKDSMTTFDLETILQKEAPAFIKNLLEKLKEADLKIVENLLLDHICYRVESANQYKQLHSHFSKIAELLVEDSINGRLISTFKLLDPIVFNDRRVYLIELPMPKNGSPYALGFEHAEFVVGPDTDLEELASVSRTSF